MDLEALLASARDNSPKAQFEAYSYYFERSQKAGIGIAERESCIYEMEFWLRKAAFNGYAPAQLELAKAEYDLYSDLVNSGEEKDYYKLAFIAGECVYWYKQAIARNYAPAVERLDYVNAFEKSVAELKERFNLTGKSPYEDLFYNEAPMAHLAGRHGGAKAQQEGGDPQRGEKKPRTGLIAAVAVIAVLAALLGVGAALFKDRIAQRPSPEATTAAQTTTVPVIAAPATEPSQTPQAKSGVIDGAGLFTNEQQQALQTRIDTLIGKYSFDVVLHTVADTGGADVRTYARNYFSTNGFGIGENRDGLIFVLNMASYEYYTSTSGFGITAFTSGGVRAIGAAMSGDLSAGRYFEAFGTYLEYVDTILAAYNAGEPYEGDTVTQRATASAATAASTTRTASAGRSAVVSTKTEPLNVRKEPLASADKLGQFAKGAKITVEGEAITDSTGVKWYRCTGVDTTGTQISGYCNADYITF